MGVVVRLASTTLARRACEHPVASPLVVSPSGEGCVSIPTIEELFARIFLDDLSDVEREEVNHALMLLETLARQPFEEFSQRC